MATPNLHSKPLTLQLNVKAIEEDFFEDMIAMAIIMPEDGYYAAWFFNKYLGTKFKINNLCTFNNENRFSIYEYIDEKNSLAHYLYTNKKNNEILIKDLKNFDFIWLINGVGDTKYIVQEEIKKQLFQYQTITFCQTILLDSLKNKSNLIF